MRVFLSILLTVISANCISAISPDQVKKTLNRLDRTLLLRDQYNGNRQARIDSIKNIVAQLHDDSQSELKSIMELADEFNSYNNDSALIYYTHGLNRSIEAANDTFMTAFRLKRATYLTPCGFINEAINEYNAVDTTFLSENLRELYYESGRQMYSFIASFYHDYPETYNYYHKKTLDSQFKLLASRDTTANRYKLNYGEYLYHQREYQKAKSVILDFFENLTEESNLYARAAHVLADLSYAQGDRNGQLYYLALSAIADLKSATREVTSLQELGALIYENGEIERAYDYMSTALANAVECHASMRVMQTSAVLPLIEDAHTRQVKDWERTNYMVITILAVLLVCLVTVLIFLRRQMRRMSVMQQHLRSANNTKEVYISQFMTLCSIYMDKLNQFCKIANRKISAGQVDELYKMTKSGKFVEEQSREFYDVFDNAFLHIYPSFVNDVNNLLRPEERILLRDGELLNTDLRILAFMRLGISDANRMAQILNYSVNTIYTYRNRMRNRAINRDSFETDIMSISSI